MDLLLEIGTEEMPAAAVYDAIGLLEDMMPKMLDRARLGLEGLRVIATPRRLAVMAVGLPETACGEVIKKKGPPLSAARGEDGKWTKAAEGFARSNGIEPDALVVEEAGKGSYVFAVTEVPGKPALEVLPALLTEVVGALRFRKSMRWGERDERFVRPVRWLLALFDGKVVPCTFGDLTASDLTYGHRYLSAGPVAVASPADYEQALQKLSVVVDQDKRRDAIVRGAEDVCFAAGMKPVLDEAVLAEVVQLVEWPGVVLGRFDERYLGVPAAVLVHAMQSHQRYFPVQDADGNIQAAFVAVHNGDPASADIIARGHQRVLTARLADAEFFYREDLKKPLSDRVGDLEHVVYQSELGSMAEKSSRLSLLVRHVGGSLELDTALVDRAERAALLAKCDLVTHVVVEFPDLQGVMGGIYARVGGEHEMVAAAIAEQYLPRRMGDVLPVTEEGALLSLAEKADNLAASFGLGHVPTGSEDPYALRRQALGMLLIIIDRELPLSVSDMVRFAAAELTAEAHGFAWSDAAQQAFAEFFASRARVFFSERYRYDLVEAVLSLDWDRPLVASLRLSALAEVREEGLLAKLYTAFERCYNLSRGQEVGEVSEDLLVEDPEHELFDRLRNVEIRAAGALAVLDFKTAARDLEPLCEPVDRLFDEVLIMAEDAAVRANRLSLLARVVALFESVADFKNLMWD